MIVTAAEAPSAGGAPLDQIAVVMAFTTVVYGGLLWVMYRERTGNRTLVGAAADRVAERDGGPRWFALPLAIQVAGALSGAVGLYWDVSFHISRGRDEGPLANPAHYLIFLGLIAIFAGGALALCLADDRLPRRTLRLTRAWRVPFGPAISTGAALCALAGFPLDDVWHRLFGQDVTEWGPTHVVMIGGVLMLPYTMLLTCAEVRQIAGSRCRQAMEWVALVVLAAGPVAFLLEFAYGVPQFPLINDPIVLTVATVVTFGLAALRGRRWVVTVWLGYAGLQAGLLALNVWVFDALTPWPPLMVGGALVAVWLAPRVRPTVGSGAVTGVAITAGLLVVEYAWTAATRPMPWPMEMMPWTALFCGLAGAGTGVVVAWMHQRLSVAGDPVHARAPAGRPHLLAALGAAVVVAVFVVNVPPAGEASAVATVEVEEVAGGDRPTGYLEVQVAPADAVDDAYWFEALSWQGGGAVRGTMDEVRPGVYRTDEPLPLYGEWKTLLRLHQPLHTLVAAPIYLPGDAAIPAEEYPAVDGPRDFVEEQLILRREEKQDLPAWLWTSAYVVAGGLFATLFGIVAVGYALAGSGRARRTPRPILTRPTGARA
ncbi:MAG: hypothetical protein ACRDO1_14320 [Nocardioidaceae bacterium]